MKESINWLEVVMDYGKRFPTATYKELFGSELIELDHNTKFSEMKNIKNIRLHYCNNNYFWYSNGSLEYFNFVTLDWVPIPQQILLRLLTEGKEDLI